MEIRGKAWRPGDLKQFYKAEYVCPEAYNDQAAIIEAATDRVRAELIAHSGTKNDPEIYYNIDSCEYKNLINDVREKALKEGREEAWDLARRIRELGEDCYTTTEVDMIFDMGAWGVLKMPVDEALEKDKAYQKEKKTLHVGDEVEFWDGSVSITAKGYVVNIISPEIVRVLTKKHGTCTMHPEKCKKTGKHSEEIEKAMASFEEGEKDD